MLIDGSQLKQNEVTQNSFEEIFHYIVAGVEPHNDRFIAMTVMICEEDMADVAVAVGKALRWALRCLGPLAKYLATAKFMFHGDAEWKSCKLVEELSMH